MIDHNLYTTIEGFDQGALAEAPHRCWRPMNFWEYFLSHGIKPTTYRLLGNALSKLVHYAVSWLVVSITFPSHRYYITYIFS